MALAEAYFRNTACGPAFDAELRQRKLHKTLVLQALEQFNKKPKHFLSKAKELGIFRTGGATSSSRPC